MTTSCTYILQSTIDSHIGEDIADVRFKYKLLSLTYKVLTTHQPQYLHNSISVQPCHNTRSSSMVTLARPPTRSSLKITNRSFFAFFIIFTYSTITACIIRLLLAQNFILNSRLGSLANPFLHRPFPFLPD